MKRKSPDLDDNDQSRRSCIAIVDDDPLFRESIAQNLIESGYEVTDYDAGKAFLSALSDGASADLVLLDWKMPEMNGIEVLRQLRTQRPELPVIFLTVLSDQIYEEAALLGGAVDFVEKSRSFSIILRRVENILDRREAAAGADAPKKTNVASEFNLGALRLDSASRRGYWRDQELELTLTEFAIIEVLAGRRGKDVSYREIYDVVRGRGFQAGFGGEGYRANVRSAIKRVRQKFRDLDPDFDCIENYPGFGYRWNTVDNT
ncbi:response regulator transcription factor [Limibacillus sp. MBR-115]|jgi:two-component system response regulator ChvI|uniref:response regulator transcription factor n=1 Tax=Limibacillus sp. MBR-115 TaxID=3156465 RepID=UPI003393F8D5